MENILNGNLIGTTNGTLILHSPITFTETITAGIDPIWDIVQAGGDITGVIHLLFIIVYPLFQELKVDEEVII